MINWIEQLALDEVQREQQGFVDAREAHHQEGMMNEENLRFLEELFDYFSKQIQVFNDLRSHDQPLQRIKIYKITGTEADFMLFRNGLKLLFSKKSFNCLSIQYLDQDKQLEKNSYQEILLQLGPFEQLQWTYQGQAFQKEALVRYYLSHFVKKSALV